MNIQKVQNSTYNQAFGAKFVINTDLKNSIIYAARDNFYSRRGRRFFDAMKEILKITDDKINLNVKHNNQLNLTSVSVKNLTNGKTFSQNIYAYPPNSDVMSLRILEFIENIGKKDSVAQQELFGKNPQILNKKPRFTPARDWKTHEINNMKYFFIDGSKQKGVNYAD